MSLSLAELVAAVNAWCEEHAVAPASGQAGETVTERNVRFYRTAGLLDAPEGGARGYGEKHLLQLVAIRLLQAQGAPLRKIRELLYGRSLAELREIRKRGLREAQAARRTLPYPAMAPGGSSEELRRMIPLDEDFLLVSRRGRTLSPEVKAAVRRALQREQTANS
jgi:DNA-binding transcriptional MerR regulator